MGENGTMLHHGSSGLNGEAFTNGSTETKASDHRHSSSKHKHKDKERRKETEEERRVRKEQERGDEEERRARKEKEKAREREERHKREGRRDETEEERKGTKGTGRTTIKREGRREETEEERKARKEKEQRHKSKETEEERRKCLFIIMMRKMKMEQQEQQVKDEPQYEEELHEEQDEFEEEDRYNNAKQENMEVEVKVQDDSEDDIPLAKKSKNKKRKSRDEDSEDDVPLSKRKKKPKKKEDKVEVWKWWEEEKVDDGTKWKFLQHRGPLFAPDYDRLPKDWRKVMTREERDIITNLSKCDFREINTYYKKVSEERKNRSKEEKKAEKEKKAAIQDEFGICPPGLFRGRGEHPKQGHRWKEVRHDNTVTWLASWTENIQNQIKYVMLNPSSKLKGEKDMLKDDYTVDFKSKEMRVRQRSVALYFIDKLALRAGNEKDEDQADTVGCCSLRVEHITLHTVKDGKDYCVEFDFLGKDSIRYHNIVPVEKRVFKNVQLFMENKRGEDDLFDRLNTTILNEYLNSLMKGLTAKVFRTFNASFTLQDQLEELTEADDNVPAKMLSYNRANRKVAILCNHQRAAPKTHDKSMQNLQDKIKAKREAVEKAEKRFKTSQKSLQKRRLNL
ncbi:TOP1 [Lepeophtheirus salmonis]|uniref:DNA topoisomerase I n=1 Tax=Lepeophtheirus salmonis TaxID=72036 RepID=A0A7R8CPC5_LEPSM|nr:TOP1 [Lepeophtheirus salmonis]CAF2884940.1 TOP1 [Lepeophtheirus salmonis]